jgi:predicted SAM-dependent methyltransferase
MRAAHPLQVIIGAGGVSIDGWFSTDADVLDITSPCSWQSLFEPESIDRLLAEHVLEHLSESECMTALTQCFRYLKRGGLLRIAVPDGYRKDPEYVVEVTPPKDGHKVLFTIDGLALLVEKIGFQVTPLEYFDADEKFHFFHWDRADGSIMRSARYDTQERFQRGELFYTSLIIDAKKP